MTQFIVQRIGKGGYAECFLVFSRKYKMSFACKVFTLDRPHKEVLIDSCATEFHALCTTIHPNIVQVFDKFVIETHVFFILEYCPNGDMASFIKKNGPITDELKLTRVLLMMLQALQYLEYNKFAHNDIKPENFLIDQHGRIKLTDFGLTKKLNREDELSEDFRGSMAYLAPEIASFTPYNPLKVDIWAFGVTVFYISTGQFPFYGNNFQAIRSAILQGTYYFPRKIPDIAREVIKKCLQINPTNRPTFEELKTFVNNYAVAKTDEHLFEKKGPMKLQFKCHSAVAKKITRPASTKILNLNRIQSFAGLA